MADSASPSPHEYRRRAMIVEDDAFTRGLLADVVIGAGFDVVALPSASEASAAFDGFDPDVLVVDIQLQEPPNGAQLANALAARAPWLGIVFVSQYPNPSAASVLSPLPRGSAFVNKSASESPALVLEAIESVLSDDRIPVIRPADAQGDAAIRACSATQVALLRLIALGYSNERIAEERGTSLRAVEQLIHRTYARLGIAADPGGNARVQAARAYVSAFGLPADGP